MFRSFRLFNQSVKIYYTDVFSQFIISSRKSCNVDDFLESYEGHPKRNERKIINERFHSKVSQCEESSLEKSTATVVNIIKSCRFGDWDTVIKKVKGVENGKLCSDENNAISVLVSAMKYESMVDPAVSFLNYLFEMNKLSLTVLYNISCILLNCGECLPIYGETFYRILCKLEMKDLMAMTMCLRVLLLSPIYWKKAEKFCDTYLQSKSPNFSVFCAALEFGELDTALKYYRPQNNSIKYVTAMVSHCSNQIQKGILPVAVIMRCFDLYSKTDTIIPRQKNSSIQHLFSSLNKEDKDFTWISSEETVKGKFCSHCKRALKPASVSEDEIEILKNTVLNEVILQDDIFIRTTITEWKRFTNFLDGVDYDIVIDGLNVYYLRDGCSSLLLQVLNYFRNINMSPLILGRKHLLKRPEFSKIRQRFPTFLTDNLSHDDVFVLYAALKKGNKGHVVSRDKMRFCKNDIKSPEFLKIFTSWQLTHHFYLTHYGKVIPPLRYAEGVQFETGEDEGEFYCHSITHLPGIDITRNVSLCCARKRTNKRI